MVHKNTTRRRRRKKKKKRGKYIKRNEGARGRRRKVGKRRSGTLLFYSVREREREVHLWKAFHQTGLQP